MIDNTVNTFFPDGYLKPIDEYIAQQAQQQHAVAKEEVAIPYLSEHSHHTVVQDDNIINQGVKKKTKTSNFGAYLVRTFSFKRKEKTYLPHTLPENSKTNENSAKGHIASEEITKSPLFQRMASHVPPR